VTTSVHLIDVAVGPDGGRQLWLPPGRHLIGRAAGVSVTLDDPSVEAHHAILDIADDGGWQLTQLAGRMPIGFDPQAGVIEVGCSRLDRGDPSTAVDRLDGGWVQLGIGLDPALHDDGSLGVTSFPQMTVIADLGHRRVEIVGLVDATGGTQAGGVRPAVRSIVAQLARRPNWALIDMSGGSRASATALGAAIGGGRRPLIVTDQAGLVRGADSPIQSLRGADVALTMIVLAEPGAPVLEACSSVFEIGPRWRSRWFPAGDQATAVRMHARGVSETTARRLPDVDRAIVAQQITRSWTELGRNIVGIPQTARIDREAAAPDARVELVAQSGENRDSFVEQGLPSARQTLPIASRRRAGVGQRGQCLSDLGEAQSHELSSANEAHATQGVGVIPTVSRRVSFGVQQALVLVEPQGRRGDAGSPGDVADAQQA